MPHKSLGQVAEIAARAGRCAGVRDWADIDWEAVAAAVLAEHQRRTAEADERFCGVCGQPFGKCQWTLAQLQSP